MDTFGASVGRGKEYEERDMTMNSPVTDTETTVRRDATASR